MRICLLANARSIHTVRWAGYFQSKGHRVHVISLDPPREMPSGVEVEVLPKRWPFKLDYFACARKVRELLQQIRPDLLHAHYSSGYGTLGRLTGFHPFLVSVWGADIYEFPQASFLHRRVTERNLSAADHVCSTSRVMAAEAGRYCDGPITITPFGVNCQEFSPDNTSGDRPEFVVGTVKALEDKYGVEWLIRSFAILAERNHSRLKVSLVIAGDGSLRRKLKSLTAELKVEKLTHFLGHVPHHQVPALLHSFSVFVALSVHESESFGVSVLEASACGLPVVVSSVGGLTEVVKDGVTGIVVPPRNAQVTADTISRLMEDRELRFQLGASGRAFVLQNYEWSKNARQMEQLYESVLCGARNAASGRENELKMSQA